MQNRNDVTGDDSIPNRLRARIGEAYGGNQRAFATAMSLSPQHVSAMLSGKIALPRPEVRRALARELGLTHGEFLVLAGELCPNEIVIQHRPLPSDEAEIVRLYRGLPLTTRRALLAIARELDHQFAQENATEPPVARPGPNGFEHRAQAACAHRHDGRDPAGTASNGRHPESNLRATASAEPALHRAVAAGSSVTRN